MNHGELQTEVVALGRKIGWEYMHVKRSKSYLGGSSHWATACNVVGWPDLTLWSVRQPGRHIVAELKVPPDKLSPKQQKVLDELAAAGFETYVWTPADLNSGAIARVFLPLPDGPLK